MYTFREFFAIEETQFGRIKLQFTDNQAVSNGFQLLRLSFIEEEVHDFGVKNSFTEQIFRQLREYFSGERKAFDYPADCNTLLGALVRIGICTDFQCAVWRALCGVTYGKSTTYGEIAAQIGSPRAARAVGAACHNNPLPILIPCHRVVGKNGDLTGFAFGIAMKEKLLKLERTI